MIQRGTTRVTIKKNEAKKVIEKYLKERANEEGIRFIKGKKKVPLNYLHLKTGFAFSTLRAYLDGMDAVEDTDNVLVYDLEEAEKRLEPRMKIPQVAIDTGIYTDPEEDAWATEDVICKRLGISHSKFATYTEGVPTLDVKDRHKMAKTAYKVAEIEKKAADYVALPKFHDFDGTENALADAPTLAEETGLAVSSIKELLKPLLVTTRGKDPNGYPKSQAEAELASFLAKPKIDPEENEHVTEEGDVYVVRHEAAKRLGMTAPSLDRIIERGEVQSLEGRKGGAGHTIYKLADIAYYQAHPIPRKPPPPRKKQPERDRRAELEQEAREIIASGVDLSRISLRAGGYSGFAKRVYQYYPGGMTALRETLATNEGISNFDKF